MTNGMKPLLKFEELGQLFLSIFLFKQLDFAWWILPACLLLPDLSMVGYLFNAKTGAWLYNFFHHKFVAVVILLFGYGSDSALLTLAGVILFGHSAMDRIFGYGLKYPDNFKNTHLGWIGAEN